MTTTLAVISLLINMGNTILWKQGDSIKCVRITDIESIDQIGTVSKQTVFKLRRASVSAGNRVKLDHMISGLTVETHDIQPKDADGNTSIEKMNKFWDLAETYKKQTETRQELSKEDKELIKAMIDKYGRNSVVYAAKKK